MDINELRRIAAETIARDDVKYLLGWQQGSFGYRVSPVLVKDPAEVEKLIFSPLCISNLAVYLTRTEKLPLSKGEEADKRKVALMVKGCDSRAVVQLLVEKGVAREQLVILGCPCPGVVDLHLLREKYPETVAPTELLWQEGDFLLRAEGRKVRIPREEVLAERCRLCRYPNPLISDLIIGDRVDPWQPAVDEAVEELERADLGQRWDYWENSFSSCLRCYACRQACPLCYCEDCVLDRLDPIWVNRAVNSSENTAFNLARAFHLAGRCVECGECERVCPVRIPLGRLNRKLSRSVRQKYGYEAGVDPEARPFMAAFCPDDPEEFIL